MILRNIDNQELQDLDFNVFVDFFTEHLFFKFMDSGRDGLKAGYKDLVDTSFARHEQMFLKKYGTKAASERIASKAAAIESAYENVFSDNFARIVSGFIKSGTEGLRSAVFMVASDPRIFQQ